MKKLTLLLILFPLLLRAEEGCNKPESSSHAFECSRTVWEKSDRQLNEAYKQLLAAVSSSYQTEPQLKQEYLNKLRLSQRAWLSYRDKNCEVAVFPFDSDTIARETSLNYCRSEMTRDRIMGLNDFLKELAG
ncbi:lysozyme inhibitor LprI family protein [Intestinirhabdus alba]|jgi:uncharacterized protein YecT (DUF1311 family)|uniref:DUF1311 domain-containing protein n=1 Tax=Intestinirhabdus alba TaxID=2899544 RepID=A0A6L6ITD1_9ENTR|nr:lysozyme inhibitor LprI family protein [Intestinirhabdus alba]MTH48636.1 DUF1311 domain-containing protein [Intestinirhabdus alba]